MKPERRWWQCVSAAIILTAALAPPAAAADTPALVRLAVAEPEVSGSLRASVTPGLVTDYLLAGAKGSKRFLVTLPGASLRQVIERNRDVLSSGLAPKSGPPRDALGADRLLILRCARQENINRVTANLVDLGAYKTVGVFMAERAGDAAQLFLAVEDVWAQVERAGLPDFASVREVKVGGTQRHVCRCVGEPLHYCLLPHTVSLDTRREGNETLPAFTLAQTEKGADLDFRARAITEYELAATREQLADDLKLPAERLVVEPVLVCRAALQCLLVDVDGKPGGKRDVVAPVGQLAESARVRASVGPRTADVIRALVTQKGGGLATTLDCQMLGCAEASELKFAIDWDAAYDVAAGDEKFRRLVSRYRPEDDPDGKLLTTVVDRLLSGAKGDKSVSITQGGKEAASELTRQLCRTLSYRLIADYVPPGAGAVEESGVMKPRGDVKRGKEELRIAHRPIVTRRMVAGSLLGLSEFNADVHARLIRLK